MFSRNSNRDFSEESKYDIFMFDIIFITVIISIVYTLVDELTYI